MNLKIKISLLVAATAIAFLGILIIIKMKRPDLQQRIVSVSEARFLDSVIQVKSQTPGTYKHLLVFYFHPDCEYCRDEIEDNAGLLRQASNHLIIMLCSGDSLSAIKLLNKYKLLEQRRIIFIPDLKRKYANGMKLFVTPTVINYDPFSKTIVKLEGYGQSVSFFKNSLKFAKW